MMFGGGGPGRHGMMRAETRRAKNTRETLSRLLGYFAPYRLILFGVGALIILGTLVQVASPFLLGQAVDCFIAPTPASRCALTQQPAPSVSGLMMVVVIMAALAVIGSASSGMQFYLMALAGQNVVRQLRNKSFEQIHRLSVSYFTEHELGDVMSRLTNDVDTITMAVNFGLVQVVSSSLALVGIIVAMLSLNTSLALVSLLVVPFMIAVTLFLSDRARRAYRDSRQQMGAVNADLQESISGVREAQAFNREAENIEQFRRTNDANRRANIRAVSITAALMPSLTALGVVATAIVAGVGGVMAVRGQPVLGQIVTVGVIVAFLNYVGRFYQPIQMIAQLWTQLQNALAGAERIFELHDEKLEIANAPDAIELPVIRGRVEFRNVTFSYRDQATGSEDLCTLCGINLAAEPGQVVALVGPTGAGKTTIINLIPRFYDAKEGAVLVDGYDVRQVTQESLRRQMGIVLQDTYLFSTTVRENIRYGRPAATDEEVEAAAKISLAHDFITRLPEGYDTLLGERGNNLSHGQRQLIAIARAALANPRILILDEATSSVDTRTERLIQRALAELMKGRTSFVVAHRLSTIRNADQVLVVFDGQIVERGTHPQLLALRGKYYDLYTSNTLGRSIETVEVSGNGRHGEAAAVPV
jgi:ATP-binding cassette subfamily B multidrug efflux pump